MERKKNRKLFAMLCAIYNQTQISQLIDNNQMQMKESNKRPHDQKLNDFLTIGDISYKYVWVSDIMAGASSDSQIWINNPGK